MKMEMNLTTRTKKTLSMSLDKNIVEKFNKLAKEKNFNRSRFMNELLKITLEKIEDKNEDEILEFLLKMKRNL